MGIDENGPRKKATERLASKAKAMDPKQTASVKDFFRVLPANPNPKEEHKAAAAHKKK
jgi:hypothetical protein